ncbi:hypothetical protein HBE96_06605 [Clostridium sp. P21]|uniref:Uncharacterized protein n=1 Tax=Clostridium muellerianum TaxID=2716538 RepID=A0A7Y0EFD0_9CLOT|nr:hypothetical protein [Clostridium muellerianum]NMM62363.1 hypothetical protein [Clostridium muellerianum]
MVDITRLDTFNLELQYSDGANTGGVITNYKPPRPAYFRKSVRTIAGYSKFQHNVKSDCILEFTVAFQIKGETDRETQENSNKYLEFIKRFSERFVLINEFGVIYKGYFQSKFDLNTTIEGDIYYISTEMLCNHDVSGWVSDTSEL